MEEETIENKVEDTPKLPKKRKSLLRRILKVTMWITLSVIGLNLLLYILLSIPFIQNKVVGFATEKLSLMMNTEVSIGEIRLSLFTHATIKEIYVEDQAKDTLLYAEYLNVRISPFKLLKNELRVNEVSLSDFLINVNRPDSVSDFNFQFIIDSFASSDSTKTDTTQSSFAIAFDEVDIKNGRLRYDITSKKQTPNSFNPSHISIADFNAHLNVKSINPDKLDISLNSLTATEQSGVKINALKTKVYSKGKEMRAEGLELILTNSHLKIKDAHYNLADDSFRIETEDVLLSPQDAIPFLATAKNLKYPISLKLVANGSLPKISVEDITLDYGNDLSLKARASMDDCMNYATSNLNLNIDRLKVTPDGIEALTRLGAEDFVAPDILNDWGDVFLKGNISGQMNRIKVNAEVWGKHGAINLLANGGIDTTFTNFNLDSRVETQNFNLGNLLGAAPDLGRVSVNIALKANQSSRNSLAAEAVGTIGLVQYGENDIRNIPFTAHYNPDEMGISIDAKTEMGTLLANASMSQDETPDIHLDLKVDGLVVDHFYKNDYWINPRLSFKMNSDIKGLDVDKMLGKLIIEDLHFTDSTFNYRPGSLALELGENSKEEKFIKLKSSILSADILGDYRFTTLYDDFSTLMHDYLPNVFPIEKRVDVMHNNFVFGLTVHNSEKLSEILDLPIEVVEDFTIRGRMNAVDRKVNIKGTIPYLRMNSLDIRKTEVLVVNQDSAFRVEMKNHLCTDGGDFDLALKMNGSNNSVRAHLDILSENIGNTDININGSLETLAQFTRNDNGELISFFQIIPTDVKIGDLDLYFMPAEIAHADGKIRVQNFAIAMGEKRYFNANGIISDQKSDSLKLSFDHAQIGDILTAFEINNVKASVNGEVLLTSVLDKLEIYTNDLNVNDIILFGDTLGTLSLDSEWSEAMGGIRVDSQLKKGNKQYTTFKGLIYPSKEELDMTLSVDRMPLGWMQPFLADMLNKMSGTVSSELSVKGKFSEPITSGFLGFNNASIGVEYTNVAYTISDTIDITPDKVGFNNLTLLDHEGNKAQLSATVNHRNFKDMKYLLDMRFNKFMILNTENRIDSMFYGKMFASGNIYIKGDDNGVKIDMKVKNDKKSNINILIPQTSEAETYKSVVFINVPEEEKNDEEHRSRNNIERHTSSVPMKAEANIEVTPDILLSVVIDPVTGDAMKVKGNGLIRFTYDMQTSDMQTFGDYTISEGSVRINLQGLKTIEFKIDKGSKLNFIGNPLKTKFDIKAYHRVKADLKTLDVGFESEESSSRVTVDCVLGIKGDMNKMELTYNISLPDANDDAQRKVRSIINTDEQKIKQFAYLLATHSFHSNAGSNAGLGDGMLTSIASSTLSGGLNALFGNILGDNWEFGTNIESSDGSFSDIDMSVDVSTRLFNDKLKLNTNLGYNQSGTSDNSFIGNFNIEYELSKIWTLKAYNKTNDRYYKQAPTTQGVGIVYTKEARSIKRLFQSFKRKRRTRTNPEVMESREKEQEEKQPAKTEGKK